MADRAWGARIPAHAPQDQPMRPTANPCAWSPGRTKKTVWRSGESSSTSLAASTACSTRMTCTASGPWVGKPRSACVRVHRWSQQADRRGRTAVRAIRIRPSSPRARRQHRLHQAPSVAGRRQRLGAQVRTPGEPSASDRSGSARGTPGGTRAALIAGARPTPEGVSSSIVRTTRVTRH